MAYWGWRVLFTFFVMCLERRTQTEAAWSVQLTFSEYWGLLPAHSRQV